MNWKCLLGVVALSLQALPALAQGNPAPSASPPLTEAPAVNCCDPCNDCCRRGGIIGGVELLLLHPYNSEGVAPIFDEVIEIVNDVLPIFNIQQLNEPDFGLEPSFRLWGGWQNAEGLGARITYFRFDSDADASTTFNTGGFLGFNTITVGLDYAIEAQALDVEVIQAFQPNPNWHLLVGAGFRWAEYQERNALNLALQDVLGGTFSLPGLLATGFNSDSCGLTLSGEARRRIGRNFALFAAARGSILFGDEDEIININDGGLLLAPDELAFINNLLTENEEDNVKFLYELRMGGEYNRELRNGSILFARITAEAQYWDHVTGVPVLNSSGAFGLFGLGLGVGLYR